LEEVMEACQCQVEIDAMVVEVSKKYLPSLAIDFAHPKVSLHIGDGFKYLQDNEARFDVIIMDSSDPVGPAEALFGLSYFQLLHNSLRESGMVCTQCKLAFCVCA
jgi:spermidine synthase